VNQTGNQLNNIIITIYFFRNVYWQLINNMKKFISCVNYKQKLFISIDMRGYVRFCKVRLGYVMIRWNRLG
jgi:hypothetical protein